jgi:hypothetical protein
VDNKPEDSKTGKIFTLENLAQVGFEIGRARQALIVAEKPKAFTVTA